MFSFTIDNPQTEIKVGEQITYIAKLKNNTDKNYTLEHGVPLITLYIRSINDKTDDSIGTVLVKTDLEAKGVVEKVLNVSTLEDGEYVLRAFCAFTTNNKDYRYDHEDIYIKVVD